MRSNYDLALYTNVVYLPISNTILTNACDRSVYYIHQTRKYYIYNINIEKKEKEDNTILYEDK